MEVKVLESSKKSIEFEVKGADPIIMKMLTNKLNADKEVEFAAYKIEHFITTPPRVVVKTKSKDALGLVLDKFDEIKDEIVSFRKQFKDAVK